MMIFLRILLPTSLLMVVCFYNVIDYSIIYEKLVITNINYSLISTTNEEINFLRENFDQIFNDTYAKCLKKSLDINFTYQWKVKPKNCGSEINVVLMIKSSIYKGEMRRILRQRWARNISVLQYHIKRIFLIGSTRSDRESVLLDYEITAHDDILQGDFLDTYKGGTKKVLLGMRYIKLFCPSAPLIIFADDDAVLSPWNLLQYFKGILGSDLGSPKASPMMFAGFEIRNSQPRRNKIDRWYVNHSDYSCPFYPPYFAGVVYAMTLPALKAMYNFSRAFEPFFCDDVLLGVLGRLSGADFRPLPSQVYSPHCDLLYKSHSMLNSADISACHEAEKPADQIFLWDKMCNWPVAKHPPDIALLIAAYCKNFV